MSISGIFFIVFSMALCKPCISDNVNALDFVSWLSTTNISAVNTPYDITRYCKDVSQSNNFDENIQSKIRRTEVYLEMVDGYGKTGLYGPYAVVLCDYQTRPFFIDFVCLTGYKTISFYLQWTHDKEYNGKPICKNPKVKLAT